jgi:hypothetical protein
MISKLSWYDSQQPDIQEGDMNQGKVTQEEFTVTGEDVNAKLKELLHESNIRRIVIKNEEGKTLIEIPMTLGVVGTLLLPVWAAVGAIAALAVRLTISVEKVTPGEHKPTTPEQPVGGDPGQSVAEPPAAPDPDAPAYPEEPAPPL